MKIKSRSYFKSNKEGLNYFESLVALLESYNKRKYERIELKTSLGRTQVWGFNTKDESLDALIVFPGARTTSLIWDFDKGLDNLNNPLRIYLVEANGLPNLSDGNTPDIKSLDYGHWANEVLTELKIETAFVAGASFGGLICMKLAIVKPEKIKAAFLLNAGCLRPFSFSLKNLYYNILPIVAPNKKNVRNFLNKVIFSKPGHKLSEQSEKILIDYEIFVLTKYKDKAQKPYSMSNELLKVKVDTYLLEGDKDLLFPFEKSIENGRKYISTLKDIKIFSNVGHGIETYDKALTYIGEKIRNYR